MNLELIYSNNAMLANLAKTRRDNDVKDSVKYDELTKFKLGKFHPELSGQYKSQDFLYGQDLYEYKYGHQKVKTKGLIGTFHNFPQVLRPPQEQFDTGYSQLIESQLKREVDVSGVIYKVGDLPRHAHILKSR